MNFASAGCVEVLMFFSYMPETVTHRRSQDYEVFKHFDSVEPYYSVLSHAWLDMCLVLLICFSFFLYFLLNNTLNQHMQKFIFWEDYLLVFGGLNREVLVLLFNFFSGFSHLTMIFFPQPSFLSVGVCLRWVVVSVVLKETWEPGAMLLNEKLCCGFYWV